MVQAKIDELSRSDTFDCGSEVSFMSSISASASVINRLDTSSASHNPETMTNLIGDLEKVELRLSNEKEEIRNVIDLTSGPFAQDIDSPSVSFAQTVAGQLTQTAGKGISSSATYIPNSVNPTSLVCLEPLLPQYILKLLLELVESAFRMRMSMTGSPKHPTMYGPRSLILPLTQNFKLYICNITYRQQARRGDIIRLSSLEQMQAYQEIK